MKIRWFLPALLLLPFPANAEDTRAQMQQMIELMEQVCGRTYSDSYSDSEHVRGYCLDAYQHFCQGNPEGVEINCNTLSGFDAEDGCPVCDW